MRTFRQTDNSVLREAVAISTKSLTKKSVQCVFAFHHDVINYPRKLHFILLAKMRVIRAAFDPFFSTPLSLQRVVKCDKLILKYVLLCQEQVSPIWLAFPPQELGIVYLRIWHPAFLSGEIEKRPPDDTTALLIESPDLVPYLNICSNNWALSATWKVQFHSYFELKAKQA